MREESAAAWRGKLAAYDRFHVYTADPGAHAMASELVPLLRNMRRLRGWYAEGWSAARDATCRPAAELAQVLNRGDTLLLGSQVNYPRTQALLRLAEETGAATIFVFDAWKNYAAHFGAGALPNLVIVPDAIALQLALAELGASAASRFCVLPNLAQEAAVERVRNFGTDVSPGTIAVLLDPTEAADGLGYDWRSTLDAIAEIAAHRPGTRLLVKPHPRQNAAAVARHLALRRVDEPAAELYQGDTERLIAMADEVWGMTTVALNVALAAGKTIRSFQIGRNAAGACASNPHIEPYAIVQPWVGEGGAGRVD